MVLESFNTVKLSRLFKLRSFHFEIHPKIRHFALPWPLQNVENCYFDSF